MAVKKFKHRRRGLLGHIFVWGRNLLIAAVVLGVGAKFYADYKLEKSIEQFSGMLAPIGTLTVGDSYTGFDGKVGASTISFIPDPGTDIPLITVEEMFVQTPGFLWALGLRGEAKVPDSMGLTINGVAADQGSLFAAGAERSAVSGLQLETLACGDITRFETLDLNNMGFAKLDTSLSARYRTRPPDGVEISVVVQTADAAEVHLDLEFEVPNLMDATRGLASAEVLFEKMTVALHSTEFNRRRNSYCAGHTEVSAEEFINRHLTAVETDALSQGYALDPDFLGQYRRFAEGEGVWTFLGRPDRPLPLLEMQAAQPLALLDRLNVNSAIGSAVPTRVKIYPVAPSEDLEDRPEITGPEIDEQGRQVIRMSGPKQPVWTTVPASEAGAHVGRGVRVSTRFGKLYSGELVAVGDGKLTLEALLPGGAARIPIPVEQISEIRVRER